MVELAGFETPEELAENYEKVKGDVDGLSEQISQLTQLKGRQGNELGQLRQDLARAEGKMEAMGTTKEPGVTVESIQEQFQNGDITEAEALTLHGDLVRGEFDEKLTGIRNEVTQFKDETTKEKYVEKFLANPENKGYVEAYEAGALKGDMDNGMSAEHAWDRYRLTKTREEMESAAKAAEEKGMEKGAKLETQKKKAGKVLGGSGGSFKATTEDAPQSRAERLEHARGVLDRHRAQ